MKMMDVMMLMLLCCVPACQSLEKSKPVYHTCKPRKTLVSTCIDGDSYVPAYVELTRCAGGLRDPYTYNCQPSEYKEVAVEVTDYFGEKITLKKQNHTRCEERCVCGKCLHGRVDPICPEGYSWSDVACRCVCGCGGKIITKDQKTSEHAALSTQQLAIILVSQIIITTSIVILVHKISRWRRKKKEAQSIAKFSYDSLKDSHASSL